MKLSICIRKRLIPIILLLLSASFLLSCNRSSPFEPVIPEWRECDLPGNIYGTWDIKESSYLFVNADQDELFINNEQYIISAVDSSENTLRLQLYKYTLEYTLFIRILSELENRFLLFEGMTENIPDNANWLEATYRENWNNSDKTILNFFPLEKNLIQQYEVKVSFFSYEFTNSLKVTVFDQKEFNKGTEYFIRAVTTNANGELVEENSYRLVVYGNQLWSVDSLFNNKQPDFSSSELIIEGYYQDALIYPIIFHGIGLPYSIPAIPIKELSEETIVCNGQYYNTKITLTLEYNVGIVEAIFENKEYHGSSIGYLTKISFVKRIE